MRADHSIVLDACVLAEAAVSDLFLRLAEEPRLLSIRWSEEIWSETRRTCISKLGWTLNATNTRITAATDFFPEFMVVGFEHLIPLCNNHPKDRHVLAAAIHSRTETIVTLNLRDFQPAHLAPWEVVAVHPADHLNILFDHDQAAVINVLNRMAAKANRTLPLILARLAWCVRPFSEHVAFELDEELPEISPAEWRGAT